MSKILRSFVVAVCSLIPCYVTADVRIKDVARIEGVRDNALVGYGLVVGLSGSGDSNRNKATVQSLVNTLANFGVLVNASDIASRNVAAVIITANLPAFSEPGDKIDVNVSSLGDAKSLLGGTLVLTPLLAPNRRTYALAQGPLSVGGFKYDMHGNTVQKNHPTAGILSDGATVEMSAQDDMLNNGNTLNIVLKEPDFTTADRVVSALRSQFPNSKINAHHAGKISMELNNAGAERIHVISRLENVVVTPDAIARVVVNERTGTVVAGSDVRLSNITISHGELRVVISTDYSVSQPFFIGAADEGVRTTVTPNTEIDVHDTKASLVNLPKGATVSDLVGALRQIKLSTRDVITILQSIKRAGALHAELIIQ